MSINILHISDLQAGKNCLAEKRKNRESFADCYARYAKKIVEDVNQEIKINPDILAVTGDIAERGAADEYKKATFFLTTLVKELGLDWRNVLIVPGNHDVNFQALKRSYIKKHKRGPFKSSACAQMKIKMSNFKTWFSRIYKKNNVHYEYNFGMPIHFDKVSIPGIMVLGLDTCEHITHKKQTHYGFTENKQLQKAKELYDKHGHNYMRIVLMHHNPFPVPDEPEQTGLREASRTITALRNIGVQLILAGHMHKARYVLHLVADETLQGKDPIVNSLITGPCCLQYPRRKFYIGNGEEILPNRYQVLSLDPNSGAAKLRLRKLSFERKSKKDGTNGAWTSDTDVPYADERGQSIFMLAGTQENKARWIKTYGALSPRFTDIVRELINST